MGAHGATLVPEDARILTHCNAGALATAGYGTALGVIRAAAEQGKRVAVLADETRPFLQGARLTAWELVQDGIDTTVITDNMAGVDDAAGRGRPGGRRRRPHRRQRRRRQQDRHLLAWPCWPSEHGIPFYVAAPLSTIDLDDRRRQRHSDRGAQRARGDARRRVAPDAEGAPSAIPAFDVTPAKFVTAIITERGIARPPFSESLARAGQPAPPSPACRTRPIAQPCRASMILGIETSCDETAAAVVEETGDAAAPLAAALQRRRLAGGDFIASGAGSCRSSPPASTCGHLRRRRAGARAMPAATASTRLPSRRGRASSARCSSACRSRSRSPGRAACRSSPCTISPDTSSRSCSRTARCRCRRSCWSSPAGTPACTASSERGRLRAARTHARRCGGGGLRQGREAARPRLSGWAGDRSAGGAGQRPRGAAARDAADACRSQRAAPARPPRLQLQRPEDVGAAPRHACAGRCSASAPDEPLPPARRRRPLRQLPARRRRDAARPAVRRGARCMVRAASASPAACRRTAGCARTPWPAAARQGLPVFIPALALSTDNAAMIAAAGLRRYRARCPGGLGSQRRIVARRCRTHHEDA